jgi:hypothetical protein
MRELATAARPSHDLQFSVRMMPRPTGRCRGYTITMKVRVHGARLDLDQFRAEDPDQLG